MVTGYSVDGFCLDTNMVFQFHGCHWYGCPECFPKGRKDHVDTRDAVCKNAGKSEGDPRHGVGVDLMLPAWFSRKLDLSRKRRRKPFCTPLCMIAGWDQTSAGNKKPAVWKLARATICFAGRHSEQRARTHEQQSSRRVDPAILGGALLKGFAIREDMPCYIPEDFNFLPEKQIKLISQWCFQIPVVGFNSECYDLNLIKKYFVSHITQLGDVKVANKQNKVMSCPPQCSSF